MECLRNLGIFSEKSLSILQTKRYASLETVKEMALKQYRLLSVENEDSNSYAILQCLNGEEVTFKVNSHHEETLLNQIGAMESECSDELLSTFKVDLVKWRRDVCYKKNNKTKGCFPDVLETNVREYFDKMNKKQLINVVFNRGITYYNYYYLLLYTILIFSRSNFN